MPLPALALLATVLAISPAEREAERLTRRSIVEYNVGDFASALGDITQAYKLDPRAGLLFNLAQCHRALEHWRQAEFFYRGYLRGRPDAKNRSQVLALIAEMRQRQAAAEARAAAPRAVSVTPAPKPAAAPSAPPPPAPEAPTVLVLAPRAAAPSPRAAAPEAPRATPPPPPPSPPMAQDGESAQPREIRATSDAAPAAAVEGQAPEPPSHAAAYVLGGVAVAAAVASAYGFLQVIQFGQRAKPGAVTYPDEQRAQLLDVVGWAGAGVALLGLGGAVIAW